MEKPFRNLQLKQSQAEGEYCFIYIQQIASHHSPIYRSSFFLKRSLPPKSTVEEHYLLVCRPSGKKDACSGSTE